MEQDGLPGRVLRTGAALAAWFVLIFMLGRRSDISWGLAIGSALSLLSFASIAWLVPRLLTPSKPRAWLLGFALLLKLPVYGLILYYALAEPFVNGMAIFAGVALVPVVIVLKAVGRMLLEATGAARSV